jgi:hypothetical protein
MSYNYGRSLFASAIENHLAIIIACAPAVKSMLERGLYPKVKHVLESGKDKFTKLRSSSSGSAPPTPFAERFRLPSSPDRSTFSVPKANNMSNISSLGSVFGNGPSTRPTTAKSRSSRGMMDSGDIELGFHDRTCDFVPTITTTITAGGSPPRPPSSKNRIYIRREITVTEEFITPTSTIASGPDEDNPGASTASDQVSESTAVSSIDLTTVTMASMADSEEETSEGDGVVRKDFAEPM